MWVFVYGSLIWNDWEIKFKCNNKKRAKLKGYGRIFNKNSVRNWGDKDNPCPTLNIIKNDEKFCEGIAFEFEDKRKDEILLCLKEREGKDFEFKEFNIKTYDGNQITAFVPIYTGKNIIKGKTKEELAEMAKKASGNCGKCSDYIKNIASRLDELGIEDIEVSSLAKIIQDGQISAER